MDNYNFIRAFIKNNKWYKETVFMNFQDSTDEHSTMMDLGGKFWVFVVVGGGSEFKIRSANGENCIKEIKKHCKDFKRPTEEERETFKEIFGWGIPWSEGEPLNLEF